MVDIFFDLVLSAVFFSGMGEGKNTGKLIFKKIFSGKNFNIVDGDTSMTFSTTGAAAGVDTDEIAFGTGAGITSSVFTVLNDANLESILGLSSIRFDSSLVKGSYVSGSGSFVIGGETNSIVSEYSVIIAGKSHSISGMTYSAIISGCNNSIQDTGGATAFSSSIISGVNNRIENGRYSTIISSSVSCVKNNMLSSVISSKSSKICGSQSYYFNINNTIISSRNNSIQNNTILNASASFGSLCNNLILSSCNSTIIIGPTRSGPNNEILFTKNEILKHNVVLSSNNSCVNNLCSCPVTSYNLILSSKNSSVSSAFSSVSGRNNTVISFDQKEKKDSYDFGTFSQILGGCSNYLRTYASSIISSINSTMSVGSIFADSGKYNQIIGGSNHYLPHINEFESNMLYASVIGGCGNKITSLNQQDDPTHFTTILAGNYNCANNMSIIVSGKCNKTGMFDHNGMAGEIIILGTSVVCTCLGSGMIFGGYKNSAFKYSISIAGSCNESVKCGVIIGGSKNCSAFQYNPLYVNGPTLSFCGISSLHNSYITGGCNNCTTSDCASVIIGGNKNVTRNVNHSSIIGGECNRIRAHGDFSGISNIYGGSASEYNALYTLIVAYKPFFTPYGGHIGDTSHPSSSNNYQTQVTGNFIIGGNCNQFKSCFPNNYNNTGPYGYQSFDFPGGRPGPAGLSNSSTSFVSNSGIVGGFKNCILNTYNLMAGIGNLPIEGSSGKYGGRLMNSVILGGQNLVLSKSNTVLTCESIFAGKTSICGSGVICQGFSGTVNSPSTICIVGGLITSVI